LAALTPEKIRWVAYALVIASAIPFGLSIPHFIKSRRAPYYILRQDALKKAWRWVLVTLVLQALALTLLIVAPRLATVYPAPTATPPPTRTPAPTRTPRPTRTPTATATRRPTATPTAILTPTPAVPLPDIALTPLPSAVPADEDARIELTALATEKDESSLPVNPGSEFPPGDHWMYLFFTYEGMKNNVKRTFAWYKDGQFLERCSDSGLWEWGDHGRTWYRCPGVWEPGAYQVHVFIETRLQFVAEFVIAEE